MIVALPGATPVIVTGQLDWAVERVQLGDTVAADVFWLTIPTFCAETPELPLRIRLTVVGLPAITLSVAVEKARVPGTGVVETVTVAEALPTPGPAAVKVAVPCVSPLMSTAQKLVDPASSDRMQGAVIGAATPGADVVTATVTPEVLVLPLRVITVAAVLPAMTV